MRVTERFYITLLERLVNQYGGDMSDSCPQEMADYDKGEEITTANYYQICKFCRRIAQKYMGYGTKMTGNDCPCGYIEDNLPDDFFDKSDYEEFGLIALQKATKMIKGWKKDHPSPKRRTGRKK